MNLKQYQDYLDDKLFHNGFNFIVAKKEPSILTRLDYIEKMVTGKSVIHVGCVDHTPPLITRKIAKNRWLHKRLTENCSRCVGIDIDNVGVEFIKNLGYHNAIFGDVTDSNLISEITNFHWDYMVLGELLEHINNPVEFLAGIKKNYKPYLDKLIISVPNAFRLTNIINAFKNVEQINTNHKYWFSAYTLAKILNQVGLEINNLQFVDYYKLPGRRFNPIWQFKNFVLKKYPILRDDIVCVVNL